MLTLNLQYSGVGIADETGILAVLILVLIVDLLFLLVFVAVVRNAAPKKTDMAYKSFLCTSEIVICRSSVENLF